MHHAGLRPATNTWMRTLQSPRNRLTVTQAAPSRLRRAGQSGTFLLVKPSDAGDSSTSDLVDRVRASVETANSTLSVRHVVGGFATATDRGIAVAVFCSTASVEVIGEWLSLFATALDDRGLAGTVGDTGTWSRDLDPLMYATAGMTFPAAFVGYRVNAYPPRDQPLRGWQVDPSATRRIGARLQAWASSTPNESWIGMPFGHVQVASSEVQEFFASTAALSHSIKLLDLVSADHGSCREAALGTLGEFVSQSVDPDLGWRALLDEQIELLLMDPAAADVGLIKNVRPFPHLWTNLEVLGDAEHVPVRLPVDYMCNRHLWDEYVIDAAGVNLLTAKHLEHASDLGRWEIDEIAPDRYLVMARDLEPWYANVVADPAAITEARRDFGAMILSWDTILANPGPYTVTDPLIVGR